MWSLSRLFTHRNRFVRPPSAVYEREDLNYGNGFHTYAQYNYLRPGLASFIKTAHFDHALELAKRHAPGAKRALDFGCADGVFLPTLARNYENVVGLDIRDDFIAIASELGRTAGLTNVKVASNREAPAADLLARFGKSDVAFSLEVLEHAGDPKEMWPSKLRLIDLIFELLAPGAVLVASVPNMVGVPFLAQRAGLWATRSLREPIGWTDMLRAGLANDTRPLEARWDGQHLGFSHPRFEEALRGSRFVIRERRDIFFQVLYVITRA